MSSKQILIIEDERPIREMIAFGLKRAGFDVREAEDCRGARAALADRRPDLMLVDWMLPDMSGLELTRALKRDRETRELPIILLTARSEEGDKVAGLEGGADDYITKPFSPRELLARIHAVLRRSAPNASEERIEVEGLALDQASHRVVIGNDTVGLGPTEYRMLEFFMTHPERVYSRDQLLDRIWGGNVYVEERTIDVHIRRLRKALEEFGYDRFIQTVRGSGYRFSAPTCAGSWLLCFASNGGCGIAASPSRPISAARGARSSPRSCACTGASVSTSNVSYSCSARSSAPRPLCPMAWSFSMTCARSCGSTGWPASCCSCVDPRTSACASTIWYASRNS